MHWQMLLRQLLSQALKNDIMIPDSAAMYFMLYKITAFEEPSGGSDGS